MRTLDRWLTPPRRTRSTSSRTRLRASPRSTPRAKSCSERASRALFEPDGQQAEIVPASWLPHTLVLLLSSQRDSRSGMQTRRSPEAGECGRQVQRHEFLVDFARRWPQLRRLVRS